MKEGPGFLLFGGTNDRALLALCRGFEQYGLPFGLIGRSKGDLLLKSRYAANYLLFRSSEKLELEEVLQAAKLGGSEYGKREWIICPTSEYLNIALFAMRDELAIAGISIATCDQHLYSTLSNKASFRTYCTELGIPPPAILLNASVQEAGLPFVAKPKNNLSRTGKILYPHLIRSERDRVQFIKMDATDEFYLEEFVDGQSWYFLFYFSADGSVVSGAQRNYLQQGLGKSIVLAKAEQYPEENVPQLLIDRLRQDGYRGFIMMEVRRRSNGEAISIEANPRCWGPFQLTCDTGMGLFEAFVRDHGAQLSESRPPLRSPTYAWLGGCIQALRSGKGLDFHAKRPFVLRQLAKAAFNDVYARSGSWSCFINDLCKS